MALLAEDWATQLGPSAPLGSELGALLCAVAGGPCGPAAALQQALNVPESEWPRSIDALEQVLARCRVALPERRELLAALRRLPGG